MNYQQETAEGYFYWRALYLAPHWPCVTYNSISTYGLHIPWTGDENPENSLCFCKEYGPVYL